MNHRNDFASIAELEAEFAECAATNSRTGDYREPDGRERSRGRGRSPMPGAHWDFVQAELHNEFLDAGGYLGELSDLALYMLERMGDCALSEFSPEQMRNVLPPYIELDDGNEISAFVPLTSTSAQHAPA